MVSQKLSFPLTQLQSLQPLEIEKLQALGIDSVQSLSRYEDTDGLECHMRWTREEAGRIFDEADSMTFRALNYPPAEFGMGALPNPGSEWMMGRTAGEINLVNFVKRTRAYLADPTEAEKQYLLKEANYLMHFLDVEQ